MKIAVLFGGHSMERDVSIASAAKVIPSLRASGHEVTAVDLATGLVPTTQEASILTTKVAPDLPDASARLVGVGFLQDLFSAEFQQFDLCFLAVHGGAGEDGTLQALLDAAGLAYTGSGHTASAVAMDKVLSKKLCRDDSIPTPKWLEGSRFDEEVVARELGWPVVVKPSREGSTVGLSVVNKAADFPSAVTHAQNFGPVLVEAFVPGRELTVGILQGQALAVGEIIPRHSDIFDYRSKYQPGGAEEIFPADVSAAVADRAQSLALAVHEVLGLGGYSRVDFRMDRNEELWCLEANTLPGLTEGSLLPKSAGAAGIPFAELLLRIIDSAA